MLALVAVGLILRRRERQAATEPQLDRSTWRMPPLFNLAPPEHSRRGISGSSFYAAI